MPIMIVSKGHTFMSGTKIFREGDKIQVRNEAIAEKLENHGKATRYIPPEILEQTKRLDVIALDRAGLFRRLKELNVGVSSTASTKYLRELLTKLEDEREKAAITEALKTDSEKTVE